MSSFTFDNYPKSTSRDIAKMVSNETRTRYIANTLLGLLGLLIVYPFLLPLRVKLLFNARSLYKHVQKERTELYKHIQTMSESELMEIHLRYEFYKNELVPELVGLKETLTNKFKNSFIAAQVVNYFQASIKIFLEVEKDLKTAVYPEIDKPLSQVQLKELEAAYNGISTEDWEDISDEYKRAYFD